MSNQESLRRRCIEVGGVIDVCRYSDGYCKMQ